MDRTPLNLLDKYYCPQVNDPIIFILGLDVKLENALTIFALATVHDHQLTARQP